MLALTAGDPSGIGPEIALKAWLVRDKRAVPPFLLISDSALMAARARKLGLDVPIIETDVDGAARHFNDALPLLPLANAFLDTPGAPNSAWVRRN